jgi:hypothetical protein
MNDTALTITLEQRGPGSERALGVHRAILTAPGLTSPASWAAPFATSGSSAPIIPSQLEKVRVAPAARDRLAVHGPAGVVE